MVWRCLEFKSITGGLKKMSKLFYLPRLLSRRTGITIQKGREWKKKDRDSKMQKLSLVRFDNTSSVFTNLWWECNMQSRQFHPLHYEITLTPLCFFTCRPRITFFCLQILNLYIRAKFFILSWWIGFGFHVQFLKRIRFPHQIWIHDAPALQYGRLYHELQSSSCERSNRSSLQFRDMAACH